MIISEPNPIVVLEAFGLNFCILICFTLIIKFFPKNPNKKDNNKNRSAI